MGSSCPRQRETIGSFRSGRASPGCSVIQLSEPQPGTRPASSAQARCAWHSRAGRAGPRSRPRGRAAAS
eukprot:11785190-Alexandrium_andersonii.AAC.1